MIDIIMDAIVCGFELYMLFGLGKNFLQLNGKSKNWIVIGNIFICIIYIWVNSVNSTILNLMIVPIIYFFFSLWNFQGNLLKKICLTVCYYTLEILPEFIFALLADVDSNFCYRLEQNDEIYTFVIILLMKMITFVLVKCIEQIHKRKYYEEEQDKIFLSLLVLPVATIIFLCGLFYSDIYISSTIAKNIVLIGSVLLLLANAFMFYLFDKMLINVDKAQKLERLYLKSNMEKRYLEQLSKNDEERRKLLHDINKYIRTAVNCISMGNVQESKEIFEELNIRIQETKPNEYCENKILNVIMTDRAVVASEKQIDFSIRIEPMVDFSFMDDIDLIAILGNLLDNAFEAAVLCGNNSFTKIGIFTENHEHFLVINVENNYMVEPVQGKKGYITIKSDRGNHGIGIHTVEQIVKKYNGRLQINIEQEHKIFAVTIIFNNK